MQFEIKNKYANNPFFQRSSLNAIHKKNKGINFILKFLEIGSKAVNIHETF